MLARMSLRLSVIGTGYLGVVHAAAMAQLGHTVVAVDVDEAKIAQLSAGHAPIYEPGLPELLATALATGRLTFTTDYARAADAAGALRLRGHPAAAGRERRRPALRGRLVRGAGQAPARRRRWSSASRPSRWAPRRGWTRCCAPRRRPAHDVTLAWNPEFLREGFAVKDTLHPDRLVYGVEAGVARRAGPGAAGRGVRRDDRRRHPGGGHRLRDRRAGQGLGERVPGHQDLVHQRDVRGVRGGRRGRRRAGRGDRARRPDRGQVPRRRHRLRRRLPAQGHPRVHGPGRRARRRPGPDVPARGRRDQHAPPLADGGHRPRAVRRLVHRQAGRGARRGLQAGQRRHPRLPRPVGGRAGPAAGRARHGARPAGHGQRAPQAGPTCPTRTRRWRRSRARTSCCT